MTILDDLHEEAEYIQKERDNLLQLRSQHRERVIQWMQEPDANIKVLADILRMTEKGIEDGN